MRVLARTLFDDCVLGGSSVSISLTPSLDQRTTPLLPPVAPAVVGVPPADVAVVAAVVGRSTLVAVAPTVPPVVAVAAPEVLPGVGVDSPVHAASSMGKSTLITISNLPGLLRAFLQ